jgi:hypothetical protein
MDFNQYNRIGVISPVEGQFQPDILAEAKAGHIDEAMVNTTTRDKIFGLLAGTHSSRDPQTEAYPWLGRDLAFFPLVKIRPQKTQSI